MVSIPSHETDGWLLVFDLQKDLSEVKVSPDPLDIFVFGVPSPI